MIYLDYAATTPVDPRVQALISQSLTEDFGNPSATYRIGKTSKHFLTVARRELKECLGVGEEAQVYFTSGATEAINWALISQAKRAKELGLGNHIVTTAIEHSAVDKTLANLETEGFEVTRIYPAADHQFHLSQFIEASHDQTIGWTVMAVNNELGSLLPIRALGQYAQERNIWFHVDSTQAVGYMETDASSLCCTSFTGSGHKFYAPKGIGFLVYQPWNPDMILHPMLHGGGQEHAMRSGTENIPYIRGMVEAVKLLTHDAHQLEQHFAHLTNYFFEELDKTGIDYQRNGDIQHHNQRIHNIWLKGYLASQVIIQLDLEGIYISAGSACSAGSVKPSKVLKAYYPEQADLWAESLRISFGKNTQTEEIDQLIKALTKLKKRSG
ncbi:cysteine desulfurase [Facklamia sp. DSM 111018]|uniref:Cysteine desulfurase n=1 Tax=Facklamia lactis TaxID=2749967 RepID=A0ABS0LNE4_9LACT|nr:cysteine desulfurase family protein [Facklamia lactis]MBG9979692.1 cysteine desulfurase [Facklamia lactis]MBG9985628.1 cysteine desulfurase [Facklamia lactis]